MQNAPLAPKKAVKLTAKPEVSDTCHICKIYCKIAVGDFGKKNKYTFYGKFVYDLKLPAGVASIPLAELLKGHLRDEVDPQDGKSSGVFPECALKIRNASTLCEVIRTAFKCNDNNACDERNHNHQTRRPARARSFAAIELLLFSKDKALINQTLSKPSWMQCQHSNRR